MDDTERKNAPIGIFDSGLGGLTVARELAQALPKESLIYVGDTARCPYGPRALDEVQQYVLEICSFLQQQGVKLIVIACNTATAAGLELAQRRFDIPIIGVIEPGARAAVRATRNRTIGVIGTIGTIISQVYSNAVCALDAGCTVYSVATPPFVEMVEDGLTFGVAEGEVRVPPDFPRIAQQYLGNMRDWDVDTLVLGCTHYPLLQHAIAEVMGPEVVLVSSAHETARDVSATLHRRGHESHANTPATYRFYTTGDIGRFAELGSKVFGASLDRLELLDIASLEATADARDLDKE